MKRGQTGEGQSLDVSPRQILPVLAAICGAVLTEEPTDLRKAAIETFLHDVAGHAGFQISSIRLRIPH